MTLIQLATITCALFFVQPAWLSFIPIVLILLISVGNICSLIFLQEQAMKKIITKHILGNSDIELKPYSLICSFICMLALAVKGHFIVMVLFLLSLCVIVYVIHKLRVTQQEVTEIMKALASQTPTQQDGQDSL